MMPISPEGAVWGGNVSSSSHQTVGAPCTLLSQLSQRSHGHDLSLTLAVRKRKLLEVSWWLSVLGPGPSCAPAGLQTASSCPPGSHPRSHHQSGFSVLGAEPACLPTCTQGCRDLRAHTASLPVEREHRPSSGTSLGTVSVPVTPGGALPAPVEAMLAHKRLPSIAVRSSDVQSENLVSGGEVVRYLCSVVPALVLSLSELSAASKKYWCLCPSPRACAFVMLGCGLGPVWVFTSLG